MDIFQPSARVGDLLNCDLVQKFKPGDETAFWKISFNGFRDQESNESPGGFHNSAAHSSQRQALCVIRSWNFLCEALNDLILHQRTRNTTIILHYSRVLTVPGCSLQTCYRCQVIHIIFQGMLLPQLVIMY